MGKSKRRVESYVQNCAGVTNLEHAKQKLTGRQAELITVAQARRRLSNSFAEYLNHLELAGRDLLARYREANRSARREADQPAPPPYFGVEWALERPPQERFMDIATDEVKDLVEAAIIALQGAITDIHDAYRNAVSEFDSIETITSEKETAGGPAGA